ncbi:unnamed protein product [Prorocentrum cordatum]|uniref:Protein kinase domain-containing protein n=1 Tax=Prorocentrum cordatum TaxID=2364126 RepID=A0ABN9RTZ8_9DINO|nr:unnamed protein product [Polarella glacialis]
MGCGSSSSARPTWDPSAPLASGSDKEVFIGSFKGEPVAVCVPKKQGQARLHAEIRALNSIGRHPHIVALVYTSTLSSAHGFYFALEAVEPVGYDLDRCIKQYLFAKQGVPSNLIRTLIKQLCSALDHMHGKRIVHRDVKAENVLVTKNYDAKLIDMGIACQCGIREERWVWASKTYFPPELCQGLVPQDTKVSPLIVGKVIVEVSVIDPGDDCAIEAWG